MAKSGTLGVWLPSELRERFQEAARQERRSMSDLARIVLEDWLDKRDAGSA